MAPIQSRSAPHAPSSSGPLLSRLPATGPPPSPQALRIMVAGVDKDARGAVEATVRQALGPRAASEPWSVSVVSLAGRWSVTLDGPRDQLRGVSFMADQSRLADAIREAVDSAPAGTPDRPAGPEPLVRPATEARDRHVCEHCGKAILVVYEARPDDPKELAPLACPHCWRLGHVEVGLWAATGHEYRAEKA